QISYFFNPVRFLENYNGTVLGKINAVDAEKNTIWFAGENGLFSLEDKENGMHSLKQWLKPDNSFNKEIISIKTWKDYVWLGTFGQGLGILDKTTGQIIIKQEKDGLINNNILAIDKNGEYYWLATLGGVARCTYAAGNFNQQKFQQENGLGI